MKIAPGDPVEEPAPVERSKPLGLDGARPSHAEDSSTNNSSVTRPFMCEASVIRDCNGEPTIESTFGYGGRATAVEAEQRAAWFQSARAWSKLRSQATAAEYIAGVIEGDSRNERDDFLKSRVDAVEPTSQYQGGRVNITQQLPKIEGR
jgi:hypothetical protein